MAQRDDGQLLCCKCNIKKDMTNRKTCILFSNTHYIHNFPSHLDLSKEKSPCLYLGSLSEVVKTWYSLYG